MAGPLADILFFAAVLAAVVAHGFILRSTARALRASAGPISYMEWVWAVLPAIAVAVLFVFTWRAMHPSTLTFTVPTGGPPGTSP